MKKLVSLLLFLVIPFVHICAQETVNQTDAHGHKQGHWIGKFPTGTVRYEGTFANDKPVGEWKRFHENGKINAHLYHALNTDIATAELFDENGIRYAKGNYKGTLKDSTWNYYNNQKLVAQEDYSNGIKNGRSLTFFENGNIVNESKWVNGLLDGVIRSFYPSGKKKMEVMYKQGKRQGLNLIYYESGQTEIKGQYNNDMPDEIWTFINEAGKEKYQLKYKAGILLNPEVVDSIQARQFNDFDRAKGQLKDPEKYSQNPDEYMRN